MKKALNIKVIVLALTFSVIAVVALGYQHAQALFKKGVAQGQDARLCSDDAEDCTAAELAQEPRFSGCNSII